MYTLNTVCVCMYNTILCFHVVCRSKDDLDFDEFLESVKARQQSMTTSKTMLTLLLFQSYYHEITMKPLHNDTLKTARNVLSSEMSTFQG